MSIDDVYYALIDGTRADIEGLAGSGYSYEYGPDYGGFSIWNSDKTEGIRCCKVFDRPNCVKIYGNKHTF